MPPVKVEICMRSNKLCADGIKTVFIYQGFKVYKTRKSRISSDMQEFAAQ